MKALKSFPTLCREQVPPPQRKPESAVGKKKIDNSIHGPGKAKRGNAAKPNSNRKALC